MEAIDIWSSLAKQGVLALMMGIAVYYFYDENKALKLEIKTKSDEIRLMAENSFRIITLVEDKINTDDKLTSTIPDIYRVVKESLELIKKHLGIL
jgi:hypothetical protein